jgi:hypothetical protein
MTAVEAKVRPGAHYGWVIVGVTFTLPQGITVTVYQIVSRR